MHARVNENLKLKGGPQNRGLFIISQNWVIWAIPMDPEAEYL